MVKKEKKVPEVVFPERKMVYTGEKKIAMDFAMKVQEKFGAIVKASILFGSEAKNLSTPSSDIDIIVIVDDVSITWDLELNAWYREEMGKIIGSISTSKELHINSMRLTNWWNDLMTGDPVVINILRYGEPLIDVGGFFNPIKALLLQGKIHSTTEAVYSALQRAPTHLARSKSFQLSSIEGIYWCMIDAAQASLMMAGKMPPSPEQIPAMLKETFVDNGMLKMFHVTSLKNIYTIHKGITHGDKFDIKGSHIDEWHQAAENFLSEMGRIINQMIEAKK